MALGGKTPSEVAKIGLPTADNKMLALLKESVKPQVK